MSIGLGSSPKTDFKRIAAKAGGTDELTPTVRAGSHLDLSLKRRQQIKQYIIMLTANWFSYVLL